MLTLLSVATITSVHLSRLNVAGRIYLTEGKKATKLNSLHIFGAFPWHHWNGWILTRIQSHEKKKEISAESDALDVQ